MNDLQYQYLEKFESYLLNFEEEIQGIAPSSLPYLTTYVEAMLYPLKAGGKRLRPYLIHLMAGMFAGGQGTENAAPFSFAVEFLHTYSLVHDDLPCMDDDDLRRYKPTTHKVYGEAQGLLVGDALLTEAFLQVQRTPLSAEYRNILTRQMSSSAGLRGMILGQWMDISRPQEISADDRRNQEEELLRIHREKTGKLLGLCFAGGYLIGRGSQDDRIDVRQILPKVKHWQEVGELLGIAFQIRDDVLDVTKSASDLGKTPQKDTAQEKLTAVSVWGLEEAQKRTAILSEKIFRLIEQNLNGEKIEKEFYEELKRVIQSLIDRQS